MLQKRRKRRTTARLTTTAERSHNRPRRSRRTGARGSGSIRLGLVLASLVGINVYIFFFKDGLTFQDVVKKAQVELLSGRQKGAAPVDAAAEPERVLEGQIAPGESLARALGRAGLPARVAQQVARGVADSLPGKKVTVGDTFAVRLDPDRPPDQQAVGFEYHPRTGAPIALGRDGERWVRRR